METTTWTKLEFRKYNWREHPFPLLIHFTLTRYALPTSPQNLSACELKQ
jgi:hypothetical protein